MQDLIERWGAHGDSLAGRALSAMIDSGRLPHAVLISGPAGVGKRGLALRIAQALVCAEEQQPCDHCRPCRRIQNPDEPGREIQHADVEIVSPGGLCAVAEHDHRNTRSIGICVIRRIEHATSIKPFEGDRRVYIVDPADAMTSDASDAFLKTLEEPPAGVYFLLLTAQEEMLSETIRSRCRALRLAPLSAERIEQWLQRSGDAVPTDPEAQLELTRLARGRPGWLAAALREGDPLALRDAQIAAAVELAHANRAERLAWAEQLTGRRGASRETVANLDLVLDAWSDWWRDLWLVREGRADDVVHAAHREQIASESPRYPAEEVSRFLEAIQTTRQLIHRGVDHGGNPRLALEVLLLSIPPAR